MCNDWMQFIELHNLEKPVDVGLGDGSEVAAVDCGIDVVDERNFK